MRTNSDPRFELRRVSPIEWVIRDHRYDENDARSTLACVWEIDVDECEVNWLRDVPLAMRYASVAEVLDELRRVADIIDDTDDAPTPDREPALT